MLCISSLTLVWTVDFGQFIYSTLGSLRLKSFVGIKTGSIWLGNIWRVKDYPSGKFKFIGERKRLGKGDLRTLLSFSGFCTDEVPRTRSKVRGTTARTVLITTTTLLESYPFWLKKKEVTEYLVRLWALLRLVVTLEKRNELFFINFIFGCFYLYVLRSYAFF